MLTVPRTPTRSTLLTSGSRLLDKITRGGPRRRASFRKVEGTILFDKEDPSKSTVKATRLTPQASTQTSTNATKGPQQSRLPQYGREFPTITFESVKVEKDW